MHNIYTLIYYKLTGPVDGQWGEWSSYTECTATCDGGTYTRTRKCNNPAPVRGGMYCNGSPDETAPCNTDPCICKLYCYTLYIEDTLLAKLHKFIL